jgi:hypothetical protein
MLTPRQVLRRLRDIIRGRRLDADVDDEVRFHIEMQTASLVAQGMSPGRARAKAVSDFGAVARVTISTRQGAVSRRPRSSTTRSAIGLQRIAGAPAFSVVAVATRSVRRQRCSTW